MTALFWRDPRGSKHAATRAGKAAVTQRQRNRRAVEWAAAIGMGKTQADVARACGLEPGEISRIMHHACPPFVVPAGSDPP